MAKYFFTSAGKFLSWSANEALTRGGLYPGLSSVYEVIAAPLPSGCGSSPTLNTGTGAITYDNATEAIALGVDGLRNRALVEIFANLGGLVDVLITHVDGSPSLSGPQQDLVDQVRDDFLPLLAFTSPANIPALLVTLGSLASALGDLPEPNPQTIAGTIVASGA